MLNVILFAFYDKTFKSTLTPFFYQETLVGEFARPNLMSGRLVLRLVRKIWTRSLLFKCFVFYLSFELSLKLIIYGLSISSSRRFQYSKKTNKRYLKEDKSCRLIFTRICLLMNQNIKSLSMIRSVRSPSADSDRRLKLETRSF